MPADADLATRISDTLRSLVGPVLADVTVRVEASRLGKEPKDLAYADLPQLSTAIERHLVSFVGRGVAETAASKVREIPPS